MKAEQSTTHLNDEKTNGAGNAIDLNLETQTYTDPHIPEGETWLKITLDKVHCVQQVMWFSVWGSPSHTWTCSEMDCGNCLGEECSEYILTVRTEGTVSHLFPISDCRYGDTVKLESDYVIIVSEIAIIGKEGKV